MSLTLTLPGHRFAACSCSSGHSSADCCSSVGCSSGCSFVHCSLVGHSFEQFGSFVGNSFVGNFEQVGNFVVESCSPVAGRSAPPAPIRVMTYAGYSMMSTCAWVSSICRQCFRGAARLAQGEEAARREAVQRGAVRHGCHFWRGV